MSEKPAHRDAPAERASYCTYPETRTHGATNRGCYHGNEATRPRVERRFPPAAQAGGAKPR